MKTTFKKYRVGVADKKKTLQRSGPPPASSTSVADPAVLINHILQEKKDDLDLKMTKISR